MAETEVQQRRVADLEQERDSLASRLAAAEASAAVERTRAARMAETVKGLSARLAEERTAKAQAEAQARGLPAILTEREDLKQQLAAVGSNCSDSAALTAALSAEREARSRLECEVEQFRARLVQADHQQAEAIGAEREARARLESEVEQFRARLAQAEQVAVARQAAPTLTAAGVEVSTAAVADAESVKLRRELSGMKVIVKTLEKKIELYQQRLLDQARKCAEELNDMKMNPSSDPSRPSSEADDKMDDDDDDDLDFSIGLNLGLGNGQWEPPKIWKSASDILKSAGDRIDDGYVRMGLERTTSGGGDAVHPAIPTTPTFSAKERRKTELQNPGSYQPPSIPDAI